VEFHAKLEVFLISLELLNFIFGSNQRVPKDNFLSAILFYHAAKQVYPMKPCWETFHSQFFGAEQGDIEELDPFLLVEFLCLHR